MRITHSAILRRLLNRVHLNVADNIGKASKKKPVAAACECLTNLSMGCSVMNNIIKLNSRKLCADKLLFYLLRASHFSIFLSPLRERKLTNRLLDDAIHLHLP